MMKPCSFEDSIRLQFNTLFKKVVDTTVKDYNRELTRRARHETPFSELPDMTVQTFQVLDKYELGIVSFDVYGMEVRVADEELGEALMKLPERKRNIILMFYFLEMSDIEIGGILHISRRSSHRNRMNSLEELRNYLQEE
ncbi:MAG: RNA polymerase sigma factor [Lachnospiraceae bacterium]